MAGFRGLLLLSILGLSKAQVCNLQCQHDAPCVNELVTFESEHGIDPDGGLPDGFDPGNGDEMHCACPHGWTGQLCEVQFASCDGTHKCYHGGQCMPGMQDEFGNEQLFCDCTHAADLEGNKYVGKFCERKAVVFCSEATGDFCVNDGTCNPEYPELGEPCECPSGFTGPHCQFEDGDESVPECPLKCENGGFCTLGDQPTYFEDNVDHAYCQCREGYTGAYCELKQEPCGEGYCLNGGTCFERLMNGKKEYSCDCSEADGDYVGRFCQFKAERYCPSISSAEGPFFCVNGGECKSKTHQGCECPIGFTGFSCEYVTGPIPIDGIGTGNDGDGYEDENDTNEIMPVDPTSYTECNLVCSNGGTCRKGIKELGFLTQYGEDASHLEETHNEEFEHCVCPEGYTGLQCDHKVAICGANQHVCFHGSTCVKNDDEHGCDCSTVDSNLSSHFAGDSCQHPGNDVCIDGPLPLGGSAGFCTNGGACLDYVKPSAPHPGCNCPATWTGPHCEIRVGNDVPVPSLRSPSKGGDRRSGGGIFFLSLLLVGVLLGGGFAYRSMTRRQRRRNDIMTNTLKWASRYQDEEPEVNLAPRRASTMEEDFPHVEDVYMDSIRSDPVPSQDLLDDGDAAPEIYLGPPTDEDGHELHNVDIL